MQPRGDCTKFDLRPLAQSLTLMRNLLRTGISTICYMRDIFGDEEFSVRALFHPEWTVLLD